ncbi:WXG100 family type VII secretion target [Stackebrandtia nassauensis]|uniref:PPE family domain-containing protein n=1 Tax=Stackebrandtia nassauensis (strain DSM 44728 / CIP 108903 / NRRL B-16338 / NBRC 102104 / LLR-40K-21) TaxID=446470 RepID=D3Q4F1_STANL|nr:WXG100 family type VII secretion target [Stackebrandtia nassauensis]ADD40111.1 hypothetical protein Snas_0394 [Stackebrandtia nassauensis DSM 44728]
MPSFEQLEMYFSQIDAASPAASAQANWIAGAAEARQLAAELRKNVDELLQYWSGPAATEYNGAMNAIIEFADGLADDMTDMSTGLASMASTAASIQPQGLAIINAARSNPYSRAAAIAPLTALLTALGQAYQSNKGQYWREPKEAPQKLPKPGGEGDSTPTQTDVPPDVRPAPILGDLEDIGQFLQLASSTYEAFKEDDFPSGVTGEFPVNPGPGYPGGGGGDGGGSYPGPGGGPLPGPDHPDYQPLPEPDTELTESPVSLAGATPTGLAGGTPAVSLGAGGGSAMGAPGGAMPMAMGMGAAGAAGSAARPAASARGAGGAGGGLFAPPMGAARRNDSDEAPEGVRTWLTEDELAWDAEPAPTGVVGHPRAAG